MKKIKFLTTFLCALFLIFALSVKVGATDTPTPTPTPTLSISPTPTPTATPSPTPTPTATPSPTPTASTGLTWTKASDVKFTIEDSSSNEFKDFNLKVSGISNKSSKYYLYVSSNSENPKIETDTKGDLKNYTSMISNNTAFRINKYLGQSGDVYVQLCEKQYNSSEHKDEYKLILENPYRLSRPAQSKLGNRMKFYFFDYKTSGFLFEPKDWDAKLNANIKIGKITDKSILKSIKNGESDCLSKLLAYAKKNKSIYTGKVSIDESTSITKNLNIVDGEYYFVYMSLDDENGKYYPVEDVSLYQAVIGKGVGKNLFDYLSNEFKWNLDDDDGNDGDNDEPGLTIDTNGGEDEDPTTAEGELPQTGATIAFASVVTIIGVGAVVGYKKYKKYNF